MAWIIVFFGAGIALGTRIGHKKRLMHGIAQLSEVLVIILLFVLGAAIGSNAEIMNNLWSLGWEGLMLAVGAIAGSLLGAKPVERLLPGDTYER
jgi:uncharacterized membrane protein YbjE (DUF340 family)